MEATQQTRQVVALVGTGRPVAPQRWAEGSSLHGTALHRRGGEVDWICGDCGATILVGVRRPETLRTVELRCPRCRRYQRRAP
jgi:DNA-directed RNA polymerase subunit RPC12/RpoP